MDLRVDRLSDGSHRLVLVNGSATPFVTRFDLMDPASREIAVTQACATFPALQRDELADGLAREAAAPERSAVSVARSAEAASAGQRAWPSRPDPEAFHGLAGDFVSMVEPHTEADAVALLVQLLVAFGNVIGRTAYALAEDTRHYCNLFTVLVGLTSKARKGTSLSRVRSVVGRFAESWNRECVVKGLSSGEGLIFQVRDAEDIVRAEQVEASVDRKRKISAPDPEANDKRALVLEAEFAAVLKVIRREGNTLSTVVRDAWDTGELRVLTKNSPVQATDAHVSIIGHITREELMRDLDRTEAANGFGNRFLWVCAKRSKCLPDGGRVPEEQLEAFAQRMAVAVAFARGQGEIRRDAESTALWHKVYAKLSDGKPGMLGAMTARSEAQVLRLSVVYALLDSSAVVRAQHLRAALASWRYCEASAAYVFGDSLGDPVADEILNALRAAPDGMTRTEIRDLFKRNRSGSTIEAALARLEGLGLVQRHVVPTAGRSAERWIAATTETTETTELPPPRADDADPSSMSFRSSVEELAAREERAAIRECAALEETGAVEP